MSNREYIQNTYDEIHAPDALFRKVKNMNKKELKVRNVKYALATLAMCAIVFATSNGICYAATGESLVEKAVLYINGEKADVDWKQEGDKLVYETSIDQNTDNQDMEYKIEVDESAVGSVEFRVEDDEVNIEIYDAKADVDQVSDDSVSYLEQQGNTIYFITGDNKIDITEDFADGEAICKVMAEDKEMTFTITGTIENYRIEAK